MKESPMPTRAERIPHHIKGSPEQLRLLSHNLQSARALLARGWIQRCMAAAEDGSMVVHTSPLAARYCIAGACQRSMPLFREWNHAMNLLSAVVTEEGHVSVLHYNDHPDMTKEKVVGLFDDVIRAVEAELSRQEETA